LYPLPKHAAGWNLCVKIMGLGLREYAERFDRANLCGVAWDPVFARRIAAGILLGRTGPACLSGRLAPKIVLLGRRVQAAFGVRGEPFAIYSRPGITLVSIPHPSGRCRAWNDPAAYSRAREVLVESGVLGAT
jgi:hypothetical protein